MKEILVLGTVVAVLYGMWMLLDFVFQMIDVYHERERSAADRRRGGGEQAGEQDGC